MAKKNYSLVAKVVRGALYAAISALAVLTPALEGGKPITAAVAVASVLAGLTAVRSYIDQSGAPKGEGN